MIDCIYDKDYINKTQAKDDLPLAFQPNILDENGIELANKTTTTATTTITAPAGDYNSPPSQQQQHSNVKENVKQNQECCKYQSGSLRCGRPDLKQIFTEFKYETLNNQKKSELI
eukprot:Pgem_evm1s2319